MNALEVFQKALRELAVRYTRELPQKLAEIEAIWESGRDGPHGREALATMQRLAHGLDVSASMLGVPSLSEPARLVERALAPVLKRDGRPTEREISDIEALLADLHRVAEPEVIATRFDHATSSHPRYVREDEPRLIYLLEDDHESAASLTTQLDRFGYRVQTIAGGEAMAEAIARDKPFAILVDVELAAAGFTAAQSIVALRRGGPDRPPVIFMSARTDVNARLEAVRSGALAYFTKPVRVGELVDKLDRLIAWEAPEPYRVLIVEADRGRAEFCRAVLREAGMDVATIDHPDDLIIGINDFNPELLLIALELPGCGGEELAQLVHQIPSHLSLPVVFLSDRWDLQRQISLMTQGGDALLPVPVESWQLISTVMSRVERYRTLSGLMQQDSLTGLLNHSRLQQYLEIEALRAARQFHSLSFAMIDLDHFKAVNDEYGHPVGDRVLKNLSRFLRQHLRKSDIVGRYGGEEFAVILTDTDGPSALVVLEKLCSDFSQVEHDSERGRFRVTFSAGVAAMTGFKSSREIVLAADRALYDAKHRGRNQVALWAGEPELA
ncbi:MAG: diguanylate cyclase [Betaproteobacteria bacterium]